MIIQLGYVAGILFKISEVSLSIHRKKKLMSFVNNNKIELSSKNFKLIYITMHLTA